MTQFSAEYDDKHHAILEGGLTAEKSFLYQELQLALHANKKARK